MTIFFAYEVGYWACFVISLAQSTSILFSYPGFTRENYSKVGQRISWSEGGTVPITPFFKKYWWLRRISWIFLITVFIAVFSVLSWFGFVIELGRLIASIKSTALQPDSLRAFRYKMIHQVLSPREIIQAMTSINELSVEQRIAIVEQINENLRAIGGDPIQIKFEEERIRESS